MDFNKLKEAAFAAGIKEIEVYSYWVIISQKGKTFH